MAYHTFLNHPGDLYFSNVKLHVTLLKIFFGINLLHINLLHLSMEIDTVACSLFSPSQRYQLTVFLSIVSQLIPLSLQWLLFLYSLFFNVKGSFSGLVFSLYITDTNALLACTVSIHTHV